MNDDYILMMYRSGSLWRSEIAKKASMVQCLLYRSNYAKDRFKTVSCLLPKVCTRLDIKVEVVLGRHYKTKRGKYKNSWGGIEFAIPSLNMTEPYHDSSSLGRP